MIDLITAYKKAQKKFPTHYISLHTKCSEFENGFIFQMSDPMYWVYVTDDDVDTVSTLDSAGYLFFDNPEPKYVEHCKRLETAIDNAKSVKELLKTSKEAS